MCGFSQSEYFSVSKFQLFLKLSVHLLSLWKVTTIRAYLIPSIPWFTYILYLTLDIHCWLNTPWKTEIVILLASSVVSLSAPPHCEPWAKMATLRCLTSVYPRRRFVSWPIDSKLDSHQSAPTKILISIRWTRLFWINKTLTLPPQSA